MKTLIRITGVFIFGVFLISQYAYAEPSAEELRQTIRDYITAQEKEEGAFFIKDDRFNITRKLSLVRVHQRVGKTGDYYYSCTDMEDMATGDLLDLDFDISDTDSQLDVVEIRIHKDNGVARYTYGENDELIPLLPTGESV